MVKNATTCSLNAIQRVSQKQKICFPKVVFYSFSYLLFAHLTFYTLTSQNGRSSLRDVIDKNMFAWTVRNANKSYFCTSFGTI